MFSFTRLVVLSFVVAWSGVQQGVPARPSKLFDSTQLLKDLQTLSADDMQGRQVGTPGGGKARAYVVQRFTDSGLAPFGNSFEVPFTFAAGRAAGAPERKGVNVVGQIRGGVKPDRVIVISAHYDHIGVRNGEVFNGADDNASGTAALFSLAQYFNENRPSATLIFVAFDAEEAGLRGARAFVASPPVPKESIILNLNMDMIGRDPDDKLFVVGTFVEPFLKPYIAKIAAAAPAPMKLLIGHDTPGEKEDWTGDSDHKAFMDAKIPALYFGVEDFGQHHKATDDYATMSHDFYVRVVETMIGAVKVFDAAADAIAARK